MIITDETICAISTAAGVGAIATIRVAGPEALAICDKIYFSPSGKKIIAQKGGTHHFGTIRHAGEDIDEIVAAVFRAPHSFTGEDIVEISCHGSSIIQDAILQALISVGCRMARPGEFTQRAFANGKMDLSQAEAVADLIASQSEAARRIALRQMKGGMSNRLRLLREKLLQFTSLLELELDFSEEDVEFADRKELLALINEISLEIRKLSDTFRIGNAIKNGVPVAIVGPTNAGKSTLLNALLGEERAIVSNIHGTTRDTVEDTMTINGVLFRFIDTAGLRQTTDEIEAMGIDRTWSKLRQAQIVISLADVTTPVAELSAMRKRIADEIDGKNQTLIEVLNKKDLAEEKFSISDSELFISAHCADDIEMLKQRLASAINMQSIETEATIVSNARHYEALSQSLGALTRANEGLSNNLSGELVALDIHEALDHLASITGEISSQDVLNNIFSKFCIGK